MMEAFSASSVLSLKTRVMSSASFPSAWGMSLSTTCETCITALLLWIRILLPCSMRDNPWTRMTCINAVKILDKDVGSSETMVTLNCRSVSSKMKFLLDARLINRINSIILTLLKLIKIPLGSLSMIRDGLLSISWAGAVCCADGGGEGGVETELGDGSTF